MGKWAAGLVLKLQLLAHPSLLGTSVSGPPLLGSPTLLLLPVLSFGVWLSLPCRAGLDICLPLFTYWLPVPSHLQLSS